MALSCPSCHHTLRVESHHGGQWLHCSHCLRQIKVPADVLLDATAPTHESLARLRDKLAALADDDPPPPPQPRSGHLGPYRLISLLGQGGMGAVYLAEDPALERQVALKIMQPQYAACQQSRERFTREAKALAAVKDDHIVTVYQVGEDNGVPFLAMELLKGRSLDAALAGGARFAWADVLRIGREIAVGLAAAHARGLIHRDVKPGNVWLEAPGDRVKLLDFGLARAQEGAGVTSLGTVVGTPHFMAPEQGRGEPVDARADLYSLGVVLYRLSSGRLPFDSHNVMQVLTDLATRTPPAVEELSPDIPPRLGDLVTRLLSKRPEDRPASARAVAVELRGIENAESQSGSAERAFVPDQAFATLEDPATVKAVISSKSSPRVRPRPSRLPLVAAGAVGLSAVLLGVIVFALTKQDKPAGDAKTVKAKPEPPARKEKSPEKEPRVAAGTLPPIVGTWTPPPLVPGKSSLDQLDASEIPAGERFAWQPKELVAVIGSHARKHWGDVLDVTVSPDGRWATSRGADQMVWLWDVKQQKQITMIPRPADDAGILSTTFSPDSKTLLVTSMRGLVVYPFLDAKPVYRRWPGWTGGDALFGESPYLRYPRFSPDGRLVLLQVEEAQEEVWDLSEATPRRGLRLPYMPAHLGFTADGKAGVFVRREAEGKPWLVVAVPLVKDAGGEKVLLRLPPEDGPIWNQGSPAMALSRDAGTLAVAEKDGNTPEVTIWDLASAPPKVKGRVKTPQILGTIGLSPNGKTLLRRYGQVDFFDVSRFPATSRGRLATSSGERLAFAADGNTLILGEDTSGVVRFGDLTGPEVVELSPLDPTTQVAEVCPHYSPRTGLLGLRTRANSIALYRLTGRSPQPWAAGVRTLQGAAVAAGEHPLPVLTVDGKWAVSRSGYESRLMAWTEGGFQEREKLPFSLGPYLTEAGDALGAENANHLLWRVGTPAATARPLPAGIRPHTGFTVRFDGALLATTVERDRQSRGELWDLSGETPRLCQPLPAAPHPYSLSFSPDGRLLAMGTADRALVLFDVSGARPIELNGLESTPDYGIAVAFSGDGRRVASSTRLGVLEVFDVGTRKAVWKGKLPWGVRGLALPEDGRHLITDNVNGTVYVLRLPEK